MAAAVALVALGYLPTRMLGGAPAVAAMFSATGVVVLGSLAGGLPILLAGRKEAANPASGPTTVMISMVVRLLTVGALAAVVALLTGAVDRPFLVWLALAYMALLVVDTRYAQSLVKSL